MRWVEECIEANMLSMLPLSSKLPRCNRKFLSYIQSLEIFHRRKKEFLRTARSNALMCYGNKCGWDYTKENVLSLHSLYVDSDKENAQDKYVIGIDKQKYDGIFCNEVIDTSIAHMYPYPIIRGAYIFIYDEFPLPGFSYKRGGIIYKVENKSTDKNGRLLSISVKFPDWKNWRELPKEDTSYKRRNYQ